MLDQQPVDLFLEHFLKECLGHLLAGNPGYAPDVSSNLNEMNICHSIWLNLSLDTYVNLFFFPGCLRILPSYTGLF